MWLKWLPWRFVISHLARSRGFIDPVALLSRLHRFAQPSEVAQPVELLRAGVVFHARGLMNAQAIQHNLDWVWPYWVVRQFDPRDDAFVPRAFSLTHVNLTHRNWTAVGLPDCDWLAIVDPRGLVTPRFDGWSLDAWVIPEEGPPLLPSRCGSAAQRLHLGGDPVIETEVAGDGGALRQVAGVDWDEAQGPCCRVRLDGAAPAGGWLAVAVRPVNPEGISFIHHLAVEDDGTCLRVDDDSCVRFDRRAERTCMSHYREGDVFHRLPEGRAERVTCDVGLATGAALFRLPATVEAIVPLGEARWAEPGSRASAVVAGARRTSWADALAGRCALRVPDERMQFLFDAAAAGLVLHSPGDVYPGPYTYKRFWFRDAAFILEALLALGLTQRVARALQRFPHRQTATGYFRSQEGEWDSNGEAIWILDRYRRLSGEPLDEELLRAVVAGARWIRRKRLDDGLDARHAGLMPAGFSAEHLGPSDYYYWDDFWSVAGLRSAAAILAAEGREDEAEASRRDADALMAAVDRSLDGAPDGAVPASPYRRLDSGAIGSVAADYPLRLWAPAEPRLGRTVEYLLDNCLVDGGFFQDMIHSGVNAYLTLHLAQVLLRAGDERHFELIRTVADLASPTGQWPEAVHPRTGGGCMGDGQHIWAAAEWILVMRNCFVREEGDRLVLASGIPTSWLEAGRVLELGPTPTPYGAVTVTVEPREDGALVRWEAAWRRPPAEIEIRLAGHPPLRADPADGSALVAAAEAAAERTSP